MAEEKEVFILPTGRLINHAVFEMDVYTDPDTGKEGDPYYKVEVAFDPADVEGENTIEDALIEAAVDAWGDKAEDDFLDGKIRTPFLDGDTLAERREEKGKEGDAYKGKLVARPNTKFNKDGVEGPGGIQVFDEEVKPVTIANRQVIYDGCKVQCGVTIHCYKDNRGDKCQKFYLTAVQKVDDGERLVSQRDHSQLFKPAGRKKGDGKSRRRSRKS